MKQCGEYKKEGAKSILQKKGFADVRQGRKLASQGTNGQAVL